MHTVVRKGPACEKKGCVALYTTGRPEPSTAVRLSTKSAMEPKSLLVPWQPTLMMPAYRTLSSTTSTGKAAFPSSACRGWAPPFTWLSGSCFHRSAFTLLHAGTAALGQDRRQCKHRSSQVESSPCKLRDETTMGCMHFT